MRNKKWWIAALAAVLVVVVAGIGVWYFVFRDDAPPEVTLESATRSLDDSGSGSNRDDGNRALDGTWTVDSSIGSFADFTSAFAGFRVQEELVGIGAKTAVGRTPDVTGTVTLDGTTIRSASFEVDMTTLTTDDARRDNALRGQAIETGRFPTATFALTQPIELAKIPANGEKITANAVGDLTLHGVTKQVTFPVEAQHNGSVITVVGQLEVLFSDYSISRPSAASVLSVEDKGVMEIQLFLTRDQDT
jgi:polyisoprenoid-binding protein YceI